MINVNNRGLRIFIIALLICGGVFIFTQQGILARSLVAAELINMGKEFYENGQSKEAIHEFSKALLIDPHNEDALFYLKEMGVEGGVYGYQKTALDYIYELNEEIIAHQNSLQNLKAQQQYSKDLQEQKTQLKNIIAQKEQEKKDIFGASEELRIVATMKLAEQQGYIEELEISNQGKKQELVRLNTDLVEIKQAFVLDKDMLKKKMQELDVLRSNFEKHQNLSEEELRALRITYEKELASLEESHNDLDHEVFGIKEQYRKNMRKYHSALLKKETELKMEKNLSAVKSYRIAQQENRYLKLRSGVDELIEVKTALVDEAELLRGYIKKIRREKTFRYSKSLAIPAEDKLTEYIHKQDGVIIDLKARMVDLLGKVRALKELGVEKDAEKIEDLKVQIDSLKKEIDDKAGELDFSQKQQEILGDRIDEYQKRLEIVEDMIKDKEERILFLEEQLGSDVYPNG